MREASASFLKKRSKKLLLVGGSGNTVVECPGLLRVRQRKSGAALLQNSHHVMAGLDLAIHAFPAATMSPRKSPVIASLRSQ
jgi:hypothetical protein